jgi:hypothetical protein
MSRFDESLFEFLNNNPGDEGRAIREMAFIRERQDATPEDTEILKAIFLTPKKEPTDAH